VTSHPSRLAAFPAGLPRALRASKEAITDLDSGLLQEAWCARPVNAPERLPTAFVTGGSGFVGGHLIERLVRDGWTVRALARSTRAAACVAELGAEPVAGDLAAIPADAARGAAVVFHLAALVDEWAPRPDNTRVKVDGTAAVIEACRTTGVERLVHLSTEAVLLDARPLIGVDETVPLRPGSPAPYAATKAQAEQLVLDADSGGLTTVAIRPRLVWGPTTPRSCPACWTPSEHGDSPGSAQAPT